MKTAECEKDRHRICPGLTLFYDAHGGIAPRGWSCSCGCHLLVLSGAGR